MGIQFNADEIFEIAERMEQNASTYYHKAADRVSYPGARQMFLDLAVWEEGHERTFHELRKFLTENEKEQITFDPYDEGVQYLHALTDESVFDTRQSPLDKVGDEPSFRSIIQFAIGKEKDSIAFYLGMKTMVPGQLGKDKIGQIIHEEMKHVTVLTQKLREEAE